MRIDRKLAVAAVAGIAGAGLFAAVALATFAPGTAGAPGGAVHEPRTAAVAAEGTHDRLKEILDGLVKKGVITQAQEDAILEAAKDKGGHDKVHDVRHDFLSTAAKYLGMSDKELRAKLPGTSLGVLADKTTGKSRAGLVAALIKEGSADIDKALAEKKITDEQAKKLRDELPKLADRLVDRNWPAHRAGARPEHKNLFGDLFSTAQSYLNVPVADLRAQLASGKSLGEIANVTSGKSRDGLVAALTGAANGRIAQAVADKRLTADQATALKEKVAKQIAAFVDRKTTGKPTTAKP